MNYSIGDIISIQGINYTIWFIEDGIYHIRDEYYNGHCGDEEWLNNIKDQ